MCVHTHTRTHTQTDMHTHYLSQSSVDGQGGCFYVLALFKSAGLTIPVHAFFFFKLKYSLDICPGVGLLNHVVTLFLDF